MLATLSEEDFFKRFRNPNDPYRHADYSGKYQMAAFFSAFLLGCLDLLVYAYFLNVAHIYQILHGDTKYDPATQADVVPELPRAKSVGDAQPILPKEEAPDSEATGEDN